MPNGEQIKDRFIRTCILKEDEDISISNERKRKNNVFNFVPQILGPEHTHFDPSQDEIYWTHVLKCPPLKDNSEFYRDYLGGAFNCFKHLKLELENIESEKYCVISLGEHSMVICAKILGMRSSSQKNHNNC